MEWLQYQHPDVLLMRTNSGGVKPEHGGWVWYVRWFARRIVGDEQTKGASDLHICYYGKFIAIECKSEKGKQSPEQKLYQKAVENSGGIYCLAYSIDDVERCLNDAK